MRERGPISYTQLDEQTKVALEAVREELRREYEAKIAELEKRAEYGDKAKEQYGYYVDWPKATPLKAFKIDTTYDLDVRELGRLQEAFLEEFSFYNLFIQGHIANDRRGTYELWVMRGATCYDPNDEKITNQEYTSMRHFIKGFVAARKAYRTKKRYGR